MDDTSGEGILALVTAADGETRTARAALLDGDQAAYALSELETYLAAQAAEETSPRQIKRMPAKQSAAEAVDQDADAETDTAFTLVQSETRFEVFDISLTARDDAEDAAPEGGFRVSVSLPEPLTGRDFQLYHIAENGVEQLEPELEAEAEEDGSLTVTGLHFVTDSFSPFVLRYTVDFTFDGYTYSMQGESSITLSALFDQLGIEENAAEAESVEFSDETLLRVERLADDWLLTSLQPFQTAETLTVTMSDGRVIVIEVTDAFETIQGDISELDKGTKTTINTTSQYFTFTPEYDHIYTFNLTGTTNTQKYIRKSSPKLCVNCFRHNMQEAA